MAPRTALQKGERPVQPDLEHRLVVKFNDDLKVRASEAGVRSLAGARLDVVAEIVRNHGATFSRYIRLPQERLDFMEQRAANRSGRAQADLAGILQVHAADEQLQAIADQLWESPLTEWVAFERIAPPPPCVDLAPATQDFVSAQDYRDSNPGLNYNAAQNLGNMTGADVRLADCEYDFVKGHEDLCDINIPSDLTPDTAAIRDWSPGAIQHGTAAMGTSKALENEYGMTGLAPDADAWFYSEWSVQHGVDRATAVAQAISESEPGDVVLLEMQTTIDGPSDFVPAEVDFTIWTLTEMATQSDVIVVAAAGNGAQDLDSPVYDEYMSRGDSGAIIVGAGSSDTAHVPLGFSTFGSRVNVQGWGENVATLGYGSLAQVNGPFDTTQFYSSSFAGTSSASAMIAGVAVALQSQAKALCDPLLPGEMRELLIDTGIPQGSGGHIGPFPNMLAAGQAIQDMCIPEGACCLGNGTCGVVSEDICNNLSGTWHGADTSCDSIECEAEPDCVGDIDDNDVVDTSDLLALIGVWGPCNDCPEDLTDDGSVDTQDLLELLGHWGPCP